MVKNSSLSAKLFRDFISLSIRIEELDDECRFKYNGSSYYIHVYGAVGMSFIYRKKAPQLMHIIHDNVLHHCSQIPGEHFCLHRPCLFGRGIVYRKSHKRNSCGSRECLQ